MLYIGDHFDGYGNDGNVLIKNFTLYDGALTDDDIKKMYKNVYLFEINIQPLQILYVK